MLEVYTCLENTSSMSRNTNITTPACGIECVAAGAWVPAFFAACALLSLAEYHTPTRASTNIASSAKSENHAIAPCPLGRMMNAASSGPIAPPRLPPTWKIDCARP